MYVHTIFIHYIQLYYSNIAFSHRKNTIFPMEMCKIDGGRGKGSALAMFFNLRIPQ